MTWYTTPLILTGTSLTFYINPNDVVYYPINYYWYLLDFLQQAQ